MELVVSVIGFGNVGKLIGGLLLHNAQQRFLINIIDTDINVAGAVLDFEHGAELYSNHQVSFNSAALLNQSDFIFHCAGASVPKGQSRLVTAKASIAITEAVFTGFKPMKNPFVVVVANPVEVISAVTQMVTGLPKQNVIGTGTFLDSMRMNHTVKKLKSEKLKVEAVLLGEHGASAYLSEQLSSINGGPFKQIFNETEIEELMNIVRGSASKIKETQEACIYGVSYCAIKIFEALLSKEGMCIPVSTFIPQSLGQLLGSTNAYLSLYAQVNNSGAHPIEAYEPGSVELQYLMNSVDVISRCMPSKYG